MIKNISYLGALPAVMGELEGSTPSTSASKRKLLFGASTVMPSTEGDNKKKSAGGSSCKSVGKKKGICAEYNERYSGRPWESR